MVKFWMFFCGVVSAKNYVTIDLKSWTLMIVRNYYVEILVIIIFGMLNAGHIYTNTREPGGEKNRNPITIKYILIAIILQISHRIVMRHILEITIRRRENEMYIAVLRKIYRFAPEYLLAEKDAFLWNKIAGSISSETTKIVDKIFREIIPNCLLVIALSIFCYYKYKLRFLIFIWTYIGIAIYLADIMERKVRNSHEIISRQGSTQSKIEILKTDIFNNMTTIRLAGLEKNSLNNLSNLSKEYNAISFWSSIKIVMVESLFIAISFCISVFVHLVWFEKKSDQQMQEPQQIPTTNRATPIMGDIPSLDNIFFVKMINTALLAHIAFCTVRDLLENLVGDFQKCRDGLLSNPSNFQKRLIVEEFESLEFRNVSIKFNERIILEDMNFTIQKGDKICILGSSGSGKSTILKLILGFVKPSSGQILLNDIPLEYIEPKSIYKLVNYLSQGPQLMNTTIRENFKFFDRNIKDSTIKKILLNFRLKDFVNNLDQEIGYRGNNLSGGERHRLAMALNSMRPKQILMADEISSGLDIEIAQALLIDCLRKNKRKTSIFVEHKPTIPGFFEKIDKFIYTDAGKKKIFIGSHEELMNNKDAAAYRKFYLLNRGLIKKNLIKTRKKQEIC